MIIAYILAVVIAIAIVLPLTDTEKLLLTDTIREKRSASTLLLSEGKTNYRLSKISAEKTVVCVHGGTIPSWCWDLLKPNLEEQGFKVLTYDMYGRGLSDRPETKYGRDLYCNQLKELVDALQIPHPFHLIGVSLGAATSVNFTSKHPEYVDKLVLIAPVINNFETPAFLRIPFASNVLIRFFGIAKITKRFKSLVSQFPEFSAYSELFREQTMYKGFRRSLLSMLQNDALSDYDDEYKTVGKQNRESLLIWGTDDTEISAEMINDVRTYMPAIKYFPVEEAGHGVLFEKHKDVNKAILSFLANE